jgi:hypothetical protein
VVILNDKMVPLYCKSAIEKELDIALLSLLNEGFMYDNGCWVLKTLFKKAHAKPTDFIDKTGLKCFVNSFHVDDYVRGSYMEEAFIFIRELFKIWNKVPNDCVLKGFISKTDCGANVKFHAIREG